MEVFPLPIPFDTLVESVFPYVPHGARVPFKIFCKGCLLPVPIQLETMHNCKERMVNAMKRMIFQFPLILFSLSINEKD